MINHLELFALLDRQDPRQNPVSTDGDGMASKIINKRLYLVDGLLSCITREEPFNRLRLKALAVHAALHELRRKNAGDSEA